MKPTYLLLMAIVATGMSSTGLAQSGGTGYEAAIKESLAEISGGATAPFNNN